VPRKGRSYTWHGRGTLVDIVSVLAERYRLIQRLGAGGMSVVWRGHDEVLGRPVAIKVLASTYAADPAFRDRIRREARAVARLSHPHITNVYDYGEAAGADGAPVPFVVMELVEGHSLAQRLATGPLPWPAVVQIGRQVASALTAAHSRGLVHRDITPANIMLTTEGVKVVDFGISAITGERGEQIILGTPAYVSPERLAGAPAQPATDVYSLGLVLHHALAGGLPPAPLPAVPPALAGLVVRCLAADPTQRPEVGTLAQELAALADPAAHPTTAPYPAAAPRPGMAPHPATAPHPAAAPVGHSAHPTGTRVLPYPGRARRRVPPPRPQPPFRHPRRGWLVLPVALLSVALLLLWGLSELPSRSGPTLAGPAPSTATHAVRAPASRPPARSPSPAPHRLACSVAYRVTLGVGGYFTAELIVQNIGTTAIDGWTLEFDFPQDQQVTTGWGGIWRQEQSHVRVRDLIYNGSMARGETMKLGFVGSHGGEANKAPSRFTLNGVRCQPVVQG
jgi:serine/threonine protein kinase